MSDRDFEHLTRCYTAALSSSHAYLEELYEEYDQWRRRAQAAEDVLLELRVVLGIDPQLVADHELAEAVKAVIDRARGEAEA